MRQDAARRRSQIKGVISSEDLQQTASAASVAAANYHGALAALDLAELNLSHAIVRSPVTGYVTHLRLRHGDYATAGETKVSIIDANSFWVVGYFEETKLQHIRTGNTAHITLMGFKPVITGHVESIGRGIDDNNDETGGLACLMSSQPLAGCGSRSVSRFGFILTDCRRELNWWLDCLRVYPSHHNKKYGFY